MTANRVFPKGRKLCALLLAGSMIGGFAAPALAQQPVPLQVAPPVAALPAQPARTVQSLTVQGNQRLEIETVLSYISLRVGEPYDNELLDQALRDLLATELFADVQIAGADTGNLLI
ncbi:MAG TPA: POTRA domain-containing protein [Allosphingosinicella sp.]|nr:POTRA domain-containing protein [Allosphingosinicella sp.]